MNRMTALIPLSIAVALLGCGLFFLPDTSGIRTSPSEQGQVLSAEDTIFIDFDFEVDRYSVEKIFSISSPQGQVEGINDWTGNKLTFVPDRELIYGGRYLYRCQGTIKDKKDRPYDLDYEIVFYYGSDSEQPPAVLSISPSGGEKVLSDSPVVIGFTKTMDQGSFWHGFSLSPAGDYQTSWNPEGTVATLTPDEGWANLQDYTIRLGMEISDHHGIPLIEAVEEHFVVEDDADSPSVVEAFPAENSWDSLFAPRGYSLQEIAYLDAIRVVFSEPMDEKKTGSAFSLTPPVTGGKVWIANTSDPSRNDLVFVPESGYDMETEYTLVVQKTAADASGNPLTCDWEVRFSTAAKIPKLEIASIEAMRSTTLTIEPPYTTAVAQTLEGDGSPDSEPYDYYFRFTFSAAFSSDEEKLVAQSGVNITIPFGSQGSPYVIGYDWPSEYVLSVQFDGFTSVPGQERYYLLEIQGGPEGVKTSGGSYLPEDIRQLLRTCE
jgi:hypothetical protein